MKIIRNLSIRTKLLTGFIAIAALIAITVFLKVWNGEYYEGKWRKYYFSLQQFLMF